jgi:hypothetical protein
VIEKHVQQMLRAKADGFALQKQRPERLLKQGRSRRARYLAGVALVAAAAMVGTALATRTGGSQAAFAAFTLVDSGTKTRPSHPPAGDSGGPAPNDAPITLAKLRQHAECMRAHGVNVPDPVETPTGWTIPVKDPPFQQHQKAWRDAFFVSCRLLDVSENLVLGGRTRAEIEKLLTCTRAHGFVLPDPTWNASGEAEFDLSKAQPAWGSDSWYRTVFVTCAGEPPPP